MNKILIFLGADTLLDRKISLRDQIPNIGDKISFGAEKYIVFDKLFNYDSKTIMLWVRAQQWSD